MGGVEGLQKSDIWRLAKGGFEQQGTDAAGAIEAAATFGDLQRAALNCWTTRTLSRNQAAQGFARGLHPEDVRKVLRRLGL